MLRSAVLVLSGNALSALLLLTRNLLIARLIPIEDYGIAATFAIVMAIVEMASFLGLHQQIVQARDGDVPRFQAALQGFQVLRGLFASVVMFLMADVIARFLGIPEVAWAYQLQAIFPLLNALQHFDIHRLNRQMRFGPLLATNTVPTILSVLIVWPLAEIYGDYRVMLYTQCFHMVLILVVSHLVAERPYRIIFDRSVMARSLAFGWPLLVNGFLMFLVFQGDKLIVGRELGMEALAIFAMGMTLTLTPTLVISRSAQNLFLPHLSQPDLDDRQRQQRGLLTVEAVLAMALAFVLATALLGPLVVRLLLGAEYSQLATLLIWLAVVQAIRIFKAGPSIIAMAQAKTGNDMYANLARIAVLPLAWYYTNQSNDLIGLILIALVGEVLALGVSLFLLQRRCDFPIRSLRRTLVLTSLAVTILCVLAGGPALMMEPVVTGPVPLLTGTVLALVLGYLAFPHLRQLRPAHSKGTRSAVRD